MNRCHHLRRVNICTLRKPLTGRCENGRSTRKERRGSRTKGSCQCDFMYVGFMIVILLSESGCFHSRCRLQMAFLLCHRTNTKDCDRHVLPLLKPLFFNNPACYHKNVWLNCLKSHCFVLVDEAEQDLQSFAAPSTENAPKKSWWAFRCKDTATQPKEALATADDERVATKKLARSTTAGTSALLRNAMCSEYRRACVVI